MNIHKENTSGTYISNSHECCLAGLASFLNITPTYLGKLHKEIHIPSAPVNTMT